MLSLSLFGGCDLKHHLLRHTASVSHCGSAVGQLCQCDAHQWNEKFQNSKVNISQHVAALKVTCFCSAPGPLHLHGGNLTKTCQTCETQRCAIWRYRLIKSDVQLYLWTTAPSPTPDWIASKLTLPFFTPLFWLDLISSEYFHGFLFVFITFHHSFCPCAFVFI